MNMQRDWVCVGDSTAKLHLLDLKNDSELMKSYSTEHEGKITGVHMTDGYLISAGSWDRNLIFSSLTDPPRPVDLFSMFMCNRVSITRIYRKKNDFDKVLENFAKSTSKETILFIIKIGKNGFAEASKKFSQTQVRKNYVVDHQNNYIKSSS